MPIIRTMTPSKTSRTQRPRSPVLIVLTDSSGDEDHTIAASAPVGLSPTLSASPTRSDNALPPSHDQDDIAEALASLNLGTPDTTLYAISGSGTTTDWYVVLFDMFLAHMTFF